MKIKILSLIICLISISSCSPVSSSWSCKSNLKGTCRNINEIDNGYVEQGDIKDKEFENSFKDEASSNQSKSKYNNVDSFDDFRSKEKVARVMFSPYIDQAGNRHDKSVVYYLEQKAEWRK